MPSTALPVPVFGIDTPSDALLADCYRNSLHLADEHRLATIAFPAISTGIFGYPLREAARVAMATVAEAAPQLLSVEVVRFVLHGEDALRAHEEALAEAAGDAHQG